MGSGTGMIVERTRVASGTKVGSTTRAKSRTTVQSRAMLVSRTWGARNVVSARRVMLILSCILLSQASNSPAFCAESKVNTTESKKLEFKEAPYVRSGSDSFSDVDVKIGTGRWQLDASLTVPNGKGPFPAVILVHGSGGHDRDETIGPNKPFRDLAHGLGSKGIAVLRYEKRTKQHAKSLTVDDLKTFTIMDETVYDVGEAAKVLRADSRIDRNGIFVLGHSLGGMVVPRIYQLDKELNGFIVVSGSNEPLEDAILRQTEYVMQSADTSSPEVLKVINAMRSQAEAVKKLTKDDVNSAQVLIGAMPAYWLDLREHDPLVEIKNVERPIFFIQGGRDYQVTADGDFARWKSAMESAGKLSQCRFKLYPQLNHLMIAGTGKIVPSEYMTNVGNVDKDVVDDIADWILNRKP